MSEKSTFVDQAAGLRHLFIAEAPRVITFTSGAKNAKNAKNSSKANLVANLAASLSLRGKSVTVLEEEMNNPVAAYFGLSAHFDLQHAISREVLLEKVAICPMPNLRILPAWQASAALNRLNQNQKEALIESLSPQEKASDFILVNGSNHHALGFSPFGLASHHSVLVISAERAAMTEAYALIKKVSLAYAHREFRVLIMGARHFDEAISVFGNLAEVSAKHACAHLEYAGFIPKDGKTDLAQKLFQPIEQVFPESAAGKTYKQLSQGICNWPFDKIRQESLENFVERLLNLSQKMDPIAIYA